MWAAEAKQSHDWDQTALLWRWLAEPNRDRESHPAPFTVYDVHPFRKKPKAKPRIDDSVSIKALRPMFKAMGVKGA